MADVRLTDATHQTVHFLADGTGLSEEEVWLLAAATVVATALVAALTAAEVVSDLRSEVHRLAS